LVLDYGFDANSDIMLPDCAGTLVHYRTLVFWSNVLHTMQRCPPQLNDHNTRSSRKVIHRCFDSDRLVQRISTQNSRRLGRCYVRQDAGLRIHSSPLLTHCKLPSLRDRQCNSPQPSRQLAVGGPSIRYRPGKRLHGRLMVTTVSDRRASLTTSSDRKDVRSGEHGKHLPKSYLDIALGAV
jgi:hypothetical protein